MKHFALALALLVSSDSTMNLPIGPVVDGDTIRSDLSGFGLPESLSKVTIRIAGIDTPESGSRARCVNEKRMAEKAKQTLTTLLAGYKVMRVENPRYDKFGGRIVGTVVVGGKSVGAALIAGGYAYEYHGGTKRNIWCKL